MRKFLCSLIPALLLSMVAAAQSADEVIAKHIEAMGGMGKLQAVKSELTVGVTEVNGMKIHVSILRKRSNKVREEISAPGVTQVQAYDGERGWRIAPRMKEPELLTGDDLNDLKSETDIDGPLVNYKDKGSRVELVGKEKIGGADTYNLRLTSKDGKVDNYYIDAQSFLIVKNVGTVRHNDVEEIVESTYGDRRSVDGIMYAYFTEMRKRGSPEQAIKIKIDKIELNGMAEDSLFEMPATPVKSQPPK